MWGSKSSNQHKIASTVGRCALCHVPRTTRPPCVKISFIVLCFLAAWVRIFLLSSFQTSLDTSCLFIFTVWRWDVFWFSLDMTNDVRIPLRMTFDNLADNISRCHSFIWHQPRLTLWPASSGLWPRTLPEYKIQTLSCQLSCLFENLQTVLALYLVFQHSRHVK